MRAVIQRVSKADISINGKKGANMQHGLVVLIGVENNDTQDDLSWLVNKITSMRIFSDEQGLMNLSVLDVQGEVLCVSQFTLHASTKKGNRPSFIKAAKPEQAVPLYEAFLTALRSKLNENVHCGEFGAHMEINLCNDGPVTICIDSKNKE